MHDVSRGSGSSAFVLTRFRILMVARIGNGLGKGTARCLALLFTVEAANWTRGFQVDLGIR